MSQFSLNNSATITTLPYNIFVYRQEIERRKKDKSKMLSLKLSLTEQLNSNCRSKMWEYSIAALEDFGRQMMYKDELVEQKLLLNGKMSRREGMELSEENFLKLPIDWCLEFKLYFQGGFAADSDLGLDCGLMSEEFLEDL